MTWPGPQAAPGRDHVAGPDLPAVDAGAVGQAVEQALGGELGLVGAEPAERAAHRVVGAHGHRLDVDDRPGVGAAGVAGGPLEHLHADRGVGPGVADDAGPAARSPGRRRRSPAHASTRTGWRLGWTRNDSSRLNVHFTGRPSRRAARAVWAWLAQSSLPPKAPPLATRCDEHPVLGDGEHVGDLVGGRPTRPARPRTPRACRRRGARPASTRARGRRARCVGSGTPRARCGRWRRGRRRRRGRRGGRCGRRRTATARWAPSGSPTCHTAGSVGVERGEGVGERGERPVVDRRPARRRARAVAPVGGDDERQHVAGVGRAPAHRDEHGPVAVDEPDAQLAGHVGSGEHALDARDRGGRGGVDGEHVGAGVLGQDDGGVQHAGDPHVVDVVLVAQRELAGLVLAVAAADAPGRSGRRPGGVTASGHGTGTSSPVGQQVDGVEDRVVAGAPAQVAAEVAGGLVAGERRARPCRPGTWCA